jgi:hypothetical protein
MNTEKRMLVTWCVPLVLLLIVLMTGSAGCIKMAQNAISGDPVSTQVPVITDTPMITPAALPQSTPAPVPIPVLTPAKSDIVTEVTPVVTPNPYITQYAIPINGTSLQPAFQYRQPEFTKTYTIDRTNPVGLLVNVVQGPLFVVYTVNPKYNCLSDPDSCRASVSLLPYMIITVRDNQTGDIVAQDGYGGTFSSDTGTSQFSNYDGNLSTSINGVQSQTYVTKPGPRYISIYKEGQFQITIEGEYVDTTISIITGTSPNPLDATEKSQGTSS